MPCFELSGGGILNGSYYLGTRCWGNMRFVRDLYLGMLTVHNKHCFEACLSAVELLELEEAVDSQHLQTAAIFVVV